MATPPPERTVIYKVGGSLLDLHDLGPRLHAVLARRQGERQLLFPGGGSTADLVRDWQPRFRLTDEDAHWLAVDALDLNAKLLARLLPRGLAVHSHAGWRVSCEKNWLTVLAPGIRVLRDWEIQHREDAPPHVWDVTSDTLAAWTAICWPADELVLLKSVPCPVGKTATDAVQAGWVDAYFPGYAGRVPRVSWCCLRDDRPQVVPWLEQEACINIPKT